MAQLEAKARELVSSKELESTVTYLPRLGEKVAGSEEERKACDYLTGRLEAYGYTPVVHEFDSYVSYPRSARLIISAPGERSPQRGAGIVFGYSPINPTPEETFIWVVTKTGVRWVRSDLGTPSLKREVAALRCGLDYDGTWGALGSRCQELLKTSYTEADHADGKPLPFDRDSAHALYKALFGQIEDVIKDKHLLIVPSGALISGPTMPRRSPLRRQRRRNRLPTE
jgi:hypothetical protein